MYANVEFINEITKKKKQQKRKATKYNNPELDRNEWSAEFQEQNQRSSSDI